MLEVAGQLLGVVGVGVEDDRVDVGLEPANSAEAEQAEPDADASASHHVDPAAPSGFRLFGLDLGKKKKEEEAAVLKAKPTSVATVSAYAPGPGLIEEELIEEEEFEAPRHHHNKAEEHDLEDFEEETLPVEVNFSSVTPPSGSMEKISGVGSVPDRMSWT